MFLDPDPKRQKLGASGLFPLQPLPASARDASATRREPLRQLRNVQHTRHFPPVDTADRPTVRLVQGSPSPSRGNIGHDGGAGGGAQEEKSVAKQDAESRLPPPSKLVEAVVSQPGFSHVDKDHHVSDLRKFTSDSQSPDDPHSPIRPSEDSLHPVSEIQWHRRSISSGNYSDSSTLKGSDAISIRPSDRSDRLSSGTTLRGTPTPTEQEHRARIEADDAADIAAAKPLTTLHEVPQEESTIRPVPPSTSSSSASEPNLFRVPSADSSLRPYTSHSDSEAAPSPIIATQSPRRTGSTGSTHLPTSSPSVSEHFDSSRLQRSGSQESTAQSEATTSHPSSPNLVAYPSSSSRPRSGTYPLRYTTSYDSIGSRVQYPTNTRRPETGRSLAASSSWASLQSSDDTLPPLQVPKKRLRHKAGSKSLGAQARAWDTSDSMSHDDDYDTQPYPRQAFSRHLSTIASESDRTGSQQLSHFSLGSGVLTGDDASSIPLSGTWPRFRRESLPPTSSSSNFANLTRLDTGSSTSEMEPGDMTLGIYREESAMPEPLFRVGAPTLLHVPRRYDGPAPPLPPVPKSRDSEEGVDTLTDLQGPPLRQKRSGYSMRGRSNSMPSATHSRQQSMISYIETDRWSHGSSIFPTWAKHFYAGTAVLASKPSLASLNTPRSRPATHARNESSWTERSITSRLGTGYSNMESDSPTSSHFLPSIFRPRHRERVGSEGYRLSGNKLHRSRPSAGTDGRPDSLVIPQDPLVQPQDEQDAIEVLPSGQARWGKLKDGGSESKHPPLPRKYSKQRHWNQMEFPRPMSKDELNGFAPHTPRLAPTKRSSYGRTSAWRPPSFVESLDSLIHSRCNRQVLLFATGFLCPLLWMLGALLPLPEKPIGATDLEKTMARSEEDIQAAMMSHEAGDAERRWNEEKLFLKARWWRTLNRIMSVVGLLVMAAVIALAVVATR